VLNDPNAILIGRIDRIDEEKVTIIDRLPDQYHDYLDLFTPSTAEKLAPCRAFDHAIDLKPDTQPPWGPIYPLSQKHVEALRTYLDDMLKQGKISPRKSPARAPILFVPKPDGRLWLVVDYRGLNKVTVHNKYPIPLMTEFRDQVRDAQIFTKRDLKDGFHLIRILKGDEWKTAFQTRYGHYQYRVMPFGLVNAATTFQTMMNEIHQQKVYSSSCVSDAQDAQDAQDVNSHSGCDVDPTPRPEDSLNVPLHPDNVLKRTLRPVRPDAFRR